MNKKTIRLTESQLHQVIKESVNKVLTELDWKTLSNAAKGADRAGSDIFNKPGNEHLAVHQLPDADKKEYERRRGQASKFLKGAQNKFDKEYGYQDSLGTRVGSHGQTFAGLNGVEGYDKGGTWHGTWNDIDGAYDSYYEPNMGVEYWDGYPEKYGTREPINNPDAQDRFDKAAEEMRKFHKKQYQYNKGQGWQLKK